MQVQGHPNPGQPYHLNGFPRVAFLPDSAKGRQASYIFIGHTNFF